MFSTVEAWRTTQAQHQIGRGTSFRDGELMRPRHETGYLAPQRRGEIGGEGVQVAAHRVGPPPTGSAEHSQDRRGVGIGSWDVVRGPGGELARHHVCHLRMAR
jgi:hypothetical protein